MRTCSYCGAEISEGFNYCLKCGKPLGYVQNLNQESYSQPYRQPYPTGMPNLQDMAPVPSTGTFIGWFFISIIPIIGFILSIVFAADSSSKVRSHFFGGMLLFKLILVLIVVLFYFIVGVSIFTFMKSDSGIHY